MSKRSPPVDRDIVNSPIFLRLGSRMRGPAGTPVGELRRVHISNVVVYNAEPRYASIISGIPGHNIEDVKLSNIRIFYQGGGTLAQAALSPPEKEVNYPEPSMFGEIPAYGFFIRHVKDIELNNVEVSYAQLNFRRVPSPSGCRMFPISVLIIVRACRTCGSSEWNRRSFSWL